MKEVGQNFMVHGEPSEDEYGCKFSYTSVVTTWPQKISLSLESKSKNQDFYVFLYLLFMVPVILLIK